MGSGRHLGIGIESTWNTPVAPTNFFDLISENIQLEPEIEELVSLRDDMVVRAARSSELWRGPFELLANYQDVPSLFYFFFGTNDTPVGAGPYTHKVPDPDAAIARPSLTLEVKRDEHATDQLTWRYAGAQITSLGCTVERAQSLRIQGEVVACSEATGTEATASYGDLDIVEALECSVELDDVAIKARSFNFQATYPVTEEVFKLGSAAPQVRPRAVAPISVQGGFELLFDSLTEYTKFVNNSIVKLELVCDTGGDENLTFLFGKARLRRGTPGANEREQLIAPFEFVAYKDTTAGVNSILQITGDNDQATLP